MGIVKKSMSLFFKMFESLSRLRRNKLVDPYAEDFVSSDSDSEDEKDLSQLWCHFSQFEQVSYHLIHLILFYLFFVSSQESKSFAIMDVEERNYHSRRKVKDLEIILAVNTVSLCCMKLGVPKDIRRKIGWYFQIQSRKI